MLRLFISCVRDLADVVPIPSHFINYPVEHWLLLAVRGLEVSVSEATETAAVPALPHTLFV